jgi:hypothetical protein
MRVPRKERRKIQIWDATFYFDMMTMAGLIIVATTTKFSVIAVASPMNQTKYFNLLPDKMVAEIGSWLASYEIKNFVQFQRTCQQMRSILGQREVISGIIKDRELSPDEITAL